MALQFVLVALYTAIGLFSECSAAPDATRTDPIWMLFARHPDKALLNSDAYLNEDGVKEILRILRRGEVSTGVNVQDLTAKMEAAVSAPAPPVTAFDHFKQKLESLPSSQIQFESSDLRRSQIEAIALKKTMPHAFTDEMGTKLKESKFCIVHSLAEKPKRLPVVKVQWNIPSISKLKQKGGVDRGIFGSDGKLNFEKVKDDSDAQHNLDYFGYLSRGLPDSKITTPGGRTLKSNFLDWISTEEFIGTRTNPKVSWPDIGSTVDPHPKPYVKEQLERDWNNGIRLLVAVGHGGWFRAAIEHFAVDAALTEKNKAKYQKNGKYGRQLATTEMVMMKWELKTVSGGGKALRITEFLDFPEGSNRFGRDFAAQFADYDEFEYDQYGHYVDEYYGDEEVSSWSALYEEARDNLMAAKEQFDLAQRLMAGDRRRKQRKKWYN